MSALCDHVFGARRGELVFEFGQEHCTSVSPHPDPRKPRPLLRKDLDRVRRARPDLRYARLLLVDDCPHTLGGNAHADVILAGTPMGDGGGWTPYLVRAHQDDYLRVTPEPPGKLLREIRARLK